MTGPDYPLLALGGYETYQLAHIATYVAERIGRHRRVGRGQERGDIERELSAASSALDAALGTGDRTPAGRMPRPLDTRTYERLDQLRYGGPRSADMLFAPGPGGDGWAVIGRVPGLGPVGASTADRELAQALRHHFLTAPVGELTAWAVTGEPVRVPTIPSHVDLAAFVEHLDPQRDQHRAVAAALRGQDKRTDAAIRGRFAGIDLDAVVAPRPPAPTPSRVASPQRAAASPVRSSPRSGTSWRAQVQGVAKAPTTSAGP